MKKLMIAALAVAFAAAAQAAAVTWQATKGSLYDGNGDNSAKITSGDAFLMFVTDTFTQDNLIGAFADANGDFAATYSAMSGSGAMATTAGVIGSATSRPSGTSSYNLTSDATAYFVVFANDKMFISATTDVVYDAVTGDAVASFTTSLASPSKLSLDASKGNQGAGWYETAAVPEPTSALMLLVGLAGLALKRKVA